MRIRYFQNQNRMAMMDGFQHGDVLKLVNIAEDITQARTDSQYKEACAVMWEVHNDDDRPRRTEIRSMSIGDVIEVGERYFKCHTFGFREMGDITIPEIKMNETFWTKELTDATPREKKDERKRIRDVIQNW